MPEIAEIVETQMRVGDGLSYRLLAWTIMPNHVHALVELGSDVNLGALMHQWKGASAHDCNNALGRKGPFWFREYWDRYMRSEVHLANTLRYIDENAVKAGL